MKPAPVAQRTSYFVIAAGFGLLVVALGSLVVWFERRTAPLRTEHATPVGSPSPDALAVTSPSTAAVTSASAFLVLAPRGAPSTLATSAGDDEATLMERLSREKAQNPALVVNLAREGNRRFPHSPRAVERASLLIHALAALGRAAEARGEAEDMVNRYSDSDWVREIEAFTGARRRRNLRLTADGGLEYATLP